MFLDNLADLLANLLFDFIEAFLGLIFRPKYTFSKVTEMTEDVLGDIITRENIKGAILDVDETLRYNMKCIPYENDKWIEMLMTKMPIVVLSNGYDENIDLYCKTHGIPIINKAFKPLSKYFKRAKELLNVNDGNILVVGDSTFCDVLGGNKMKMITVKIKAKKEKKSNKKR